MAKITNAGLALIAQLQANEDTLVIDKMIYADVDGIDYNQQPPGTEVLPAPGDIVRESDIAAAGYIEPNTVVYSDVMDSTIGDFSFNWVGLYCSEFSTLVAAAYVPPQYKRATSGFNTGNTVCKNFAINYTDIQDLTGIVIEAETWQQDFSGLYAPIDHNHDDNYAPLGHNHDEDYAAINHTHPEKTVAACGVVSAAGAKLCGSDNWTVARNSTGNYQLNITDAGNYMVAIWCANTSSLLQSCNAANHNTSTGYFNNNTASNVVFRDRHDGSIGADVQWAFTAIKL